jgi:hypothetical protein
MAAEVKLQHASIYFIHFCCMDIYFVSQVAQSVYQYSVWLRAGRPGDRGSIPSRGERIFPVASVSILALGLTQPPVQWVWRDPFPGAKARLGCDTDHSPPSSAKVENE